VHDFVVVGAGTAGCVLAARLSEDRGTRVLLLEAGPGDRALEVRIPAAFSRLYDSRLDWCFRTVPQPALDGRQIVFPRGKVLGGSSSLNAMMVLRGHPADQEAWGEGWTWADVEPAYRRSEPSFPRATLRAPHPLTLAFVESARAAGLPAAEDLNGPDPTGVGVVPVSQRRGRRHSVVDGYLRPARRRRNLDVLTGAHATRVLVDGGRATGVRYLRNGVVADAAARRGVVLCGGAIGSPQLLLLSGIGPAAELEAAGVEPVHDLRGVGRNLRDHVATGILVLTGAGARSLAGADSPLNLLRWLVLRRGPLTSNVAEAAAFVRTRDGLAGPDLELVFAPVLFQDEGLTRPTEHGVTLAAVLLQPRSAGSVSLRSADPLAPPAIDPGYLSDPTGEDAATLLRGLRLARRIAATPPLAGQLATELLPGAEASSEDDLLRHVRAASQSLYHPVGTCRLGDDEGAVVDRSLRVHGLDGVHVVDASVIPAPPRGHTNWPTVMVAERAAELLRDA
jgi:choline dehydrogenase